MAQKLRILCVCAGGVVRSVTMAALLKVYWKMDALAAGFMNEPETLKYLYEWADHIYVVQEYMYTQVPEEYRYKTRVIDLGEDVWGHSNHPDLVRTLYPILEREFGPDRKTEPFEVHLARREAKVKAKQPTRLF